MSFEPNTRSTVVVEFPDIALRLTREQWLTVMLSLAGRTPDRKRREAAETRLIEQLRDYGSRS